MKLTKTYYLILLACTVSCGHFEPVEKEEFPPIWPDYTDVTIPANIAPMNSHKCIIPRILIIKTT